MLVEPRARIVWPGGKDRIVAAQTKAVCSVLEDMQLDGNLILEARHRKLQAVLHRHDFVVGAMNQKTRRRFGGHLLLVAKQVDEFGIGAVAKQISFCDPWWTYGSSKLTTG